MVLEICHINIAITFYVDQLTLITNLPTNPKLW